MTSQTKILLRRCFSGNTFKGQISFTLSVYQLYVVACSVGFMTINFLPFGAWSRWCYMVHVESNNIYLINEDKITRAFRVWICLRSVSSSSLCNNFQHVTYIVRRFVFSSLTVKNAAKCNTLTLQYMPNKYLMRCSMFFYYTF